MRILALPRRAGKTTALLEWLREPTDPDEVRVSVSLDRHRAMQLYRRQLQEAEREGRYPLDSWRFVGLDEAVDRRCWRWIRGTIVAGVDDAEQILSAVLNRPIGALTCTADEQEPTP